jgi:hypothetical protein
VGPRTDCASEGPTQEPFSNFSGCNAGIGWSCKSDPWEHMRSPEDHTLSHILQHINIYGNVEYAKLWRPSTKSLLPDSCWFINWVTFLPWRWRGLVPPKRPLNFNGLHGIVFQKTEKSFFFFFPFLFLYFFLHFLELSICLYSQIWRYWIFIKSDQWFEYKSAPIRC